MATTDAIPAVPAEQTVRTGPIARRRLGLSLSVAAVTVLLAAASAPSPFYPGMQARFGISPVGIALVFAIYAVALLVTLLTVGSLSDHIGRRPAVTAGFFMLAVSMLIMWSADTSTMLIAARGVQGLASGVLLSTLSASITDFAPPAKPGRASLLNSAAPMGGLALGAVFAGVALEFSSHAASIVFGSLGAAYVALAAGIWSVPETCRRTPGWRRAIQPRVVVPVPARRLFTISIPIIVAGWATGGLFFSLGPDIVQTQLHVTGAVAGSAIIAILPASGMLAVFYLHGRSPRVATLFAAVALTVGTLLTLLGLDIGSVATYIVGVVITGTGFGTGFMGVIGSLTPTVPAHQRAELFAALYTAAYLSFGVPTVLAGSLVPVASLSTTTLIYGIVVSVFAAAAGVFRAVARE